MHCVSFRVFRNTYNVIPTSIRLTYNMRENVPSCSHGLARFSWPITDAVITAAALFAFTFYGCKFYYHTCVAIFSFRGLWCNSEVESIVHDPFITKHGGSGEKCYGKCC